MSLVGSTKNEYPKTHGYGASQSRAHGNSNVQRSFIELGDRSKHSGHSEVDLVPRDYKGQGEGMGTKTLVESADPMQDSSSEDGVPGIMVTTAVARVHETR